MSEQAGRFTRQPAHVLMLDLSRPFNHDILVNLYQSLTNFFSLVTNINGPCRVPLFGLSAVGQYPETIFPLQHVKGNFARLHSVLTDFKSSAVDVRMTEFDPDSFSQGLKDVISQYQRQQQAIRQVTHSPCQLEISILTCQPAHFICDQVNKVGQSLDLDILKKIQVLSVAVENDQVMINSQSASTDGDSNNSGSDLISGMVDIIPLENDKLSIMNFLKTWLKDCGTDRENIHLILPPKVNSAEEFMETDSGSQANILKCDLHDTFINPLNLLCSEYFILPGDLVTCTKPYTQSTNKAVSNAQSKCTVQRLKAFSLVRSSGICESVPRFVRPTCCWKLDWEELESNQRDFSALCQILHEKDLSLVVKSVPENLGSQTVPNAFFLLMASSVTTLLIKAIAFDEIMLPSNLPAFNEKTLQESTQVIEDSLDKLPLQDVYNPYLVRSDLFKFFVSKSVKNNQAGRGSKRKFQAPQKTQGSNPPTRQSTGRGQSVACQPSKRMVSFQSPRSSSSILGTSGKTATPKRGRTLPAVAVLEPNPKFYQ